ncbi:MAG: sigma-70 family RNA polymerase sigma factor [Aridibacter famidurans]|nr:sigma-70 family RNA polymerase sigma factor [Aridibacter famidurans]
MPQEITQILQDWRKGDESAVERLMPVVHAELKRLARSYLSRERAGHTLQPTALVNEAFLRFARINDLDWQDRAHFFAVSATIMRQILVDHARRIATDKRGGGMKRLTLDNLRIANETKAADLLGLEMALEKLAEIDARKVKVVEMKFFSGLKHEEIAEVLGVTEKTIQRDWKIAKLWLYRELAGTEQG